MAVWDSRGVSEILVHCSAIGRTREQDNVTALGGAQGQLIESEDLAHGLEDTAMDTAAPMKCTHPHLQFRDLLNTHGIDCSPYNHSGFAFLARKLHLPDHQGKGQRQPVGATHKQHL